MPSGSLTNTLFRHTILFPALPLLLFLSSCKQESTTPVVTQTRGFALGFTYFPYDGGSAGLTFALNVITNDGDMLVAHFDYGIPWDAALANDFTQYPQDVRDEINGITGAIPANHKVYVAVTPIAVTRDRLAPTRGANGAQTFQPPWDGYTFNNPNVIKAYINHCRIMIDRFHPDYFAFSIEANILRDLAVDSVWDQYLALATAVYDTLKQNYPALPIFQTIQSGIFYHHQAAQTTALLQLQPSMDYIAVSAYPYAEYDRYQGDSAADPIKLPSSYFSTIAKIAIGKPFAISETAWPAEDVTPPYPITIHSNANYQKAYVDFLLSSCGALSAKFVCWFFTRDYDQFWNTSLKSMPDSSLVRLWKDTGLYDGNGNARPALNSWRAYLARLRK